MNVLLPSGVVVQELAAGSVFNYQGFVNMSETTSMNLNNGQAIGTESLFEIRCSTPCLIGEITLEELQPLMVKHWEI